MATSTERSQRTRARQRVLRRCYTIEADEVALADTLQRAGYLDPLKADDPEAQRLALQRVIADLKLG